MAIRAATVADSRRGATAAATAFDQVAWLVFAAAAATAAGIVLWIGHDTTFSPDELTWFLSSPDLDLDGALQPHAGHLILTTRIVYKALFEIAGADYLTFRLLAMATVVLTAGLLFAYAKRRVGAVVALAPTLVLLVFGSDPTHVLEGNAFTVLGAISCGLGALLALERDDRRGDAVACALLCLGVATYTVALAFVAGIGLSILLGRGRWGRMWIVVLPLALYGAWWLWARDSASSSDDALALSQLLTYPAWAFQSLAAVLGSLVGLDYDFGGEAAAGTGSALALLALAGLGWRMSRPPIPPMLWSVLAILGVLWMMQALAQAPLRTPESSRYLFPGAVGVVLVAAWAAAGVSWGRRGLIALFGVAAIGVLTNIALLRDGADNLRTGAVQTRAELTGLGFADGAADPDYIPTSASGGATSVTLAFTEYASDGSSPTAAYLAAAGRYGSPAYSTEALAARDDAARARADATLVAALGLSLQPTAGHPPSARCTELGGADGASFELAPGDSVTLEASREQADVQVRRLADTGTGIGSLSPGQTATLSVPVDAAPGLWHVLAPGAPVLVCRGAR